MEIKVGIKRHASTHLEELESQIWNIIMNSYIVCINFLILKIMESLSSLVQNAFSCDILITIS